MVVSEQTMYRTICECGMIPFFAGPVPGYSVEEKTSAEYWFGGDAGVLGPWDWKIGCIQSGDIFYGKYLCGGKAAFATLEWYRELRNYRQSLEKYALQPGPQTEIMGYLNGNGTITIKEVRGILGIKKSAADALITRLQMQCRVVTGDITRVYRGEDLHYNGWQVSSFCAPEELFGSGTPFAAFPGFPFREETGLEVNHSPEESLRLLKEKIRSLFPEATDKQMEKMLA